MSYKKLMRSNNKMIAGVCSGIGEYFDVDPTLIRILYVLASLLTGILPLAIAYIILVIIIPQK